MPTANTATLCRQTCCIFKQKTKLGKINFKNEMLSNYSENDGNQIFCIIFLLFPEIIRNLEIVKKC